MTIGMVAQLAGRFTDAGSSPAHPIGESPKCMYDSLERQAYFGGGIGRRYWV